MTPPAEGSAIDRIVDILRLPNRRSLLIHALAIPFGGAFAILGALAIIEDAPPGIDPAPGTTSAALLVPMLMILFVRRRFPFTTLAVSTVLLLIIREVDVPELQVSSIAWAVSLYSAGRYGADRGRSLVRALAIAAVIGFVIRDVAETWDQLDLLGVTERFFFLQATSNVIGNLVLFAVVWYAGDLALKRHQRERDLAARTIELEASRAENARRAVMDERVRIAREVHDVVAHHVSVMGVQAGAARRAMRSDPDRAEGPLLSVEESSREAVGELHRLLGFLRRADEDDPDGLGDGALAPRPGLDRLPDLRRQLAGAGLALRLGVDGDIRPLPSSVDLTAYRIIQEALTNTLKYAGVDHAEVTIRYEPDRLSLRVSDRGRGPQPSSASGGAGLIGMAERVALVGGRLRHGPRPGGGFEVVASLPYAGTVEAAPAAMPTSGTTPIPTPMPTSGTTDDGSDDDR